MKSILHQQAQGREREMAARRPAGAHVPADLPAVPGPGAARPLLAPAGTTPWNWTASPRLGVNATRFTRPCNFERQALGTGAPHGINASGSADRSQVLPKAAFQVLDSVDSQDGCEEGCHYCNGPETD